MKNQYMTQKKKNLSKILINFPKIHIKFFLKWNINMTEKKENVLKILIKLYENSLKKNFWNEKSIYDPKKIFQNPHKLHKNS